MKKILTILILTFFVTISSSRYVYSETCNSYKIYGEVISTEENGNLYLIDGGNGVPYIHPIDAVYYADFDRYWTENGNHMFQKGNHIVTYKGPEVNYNNDTYLRMDRIFNDLSCSYSATNDSIIFSPTEMFNEDLFYECEQILNRGFSLEEMANVPFARGTVVTYEFITGKFSYLWGGRQKERYEKAIMGILVPKENDSTFLSFIEKACKKYDGITNFYEYDDEILDGAVLETLEGVIPDLIPDKSFFETWKTLNKAMPGISVKDGFSLLKNSYGVQHGLETYKKALYYGLYKNNSVEDGNLDYAVEKIYKNYDVSYVSAFIDALASKFGNNMGTKLVKEWIQDELKYDPISYKFSKAMFDYYYGMKNNTGSVIAIEDCWEIQKEALKQYNNSFTKNKDGTVNVKNPEQMKYSMILYLRAYQYACEQYGKSKEAFTSFDDELAKAASKKGVEATKSLLEKILSFEDNVNTEIKNKQLSLKDDRFTKVEDCTIETNNKPSPSTPPSSTFDLNLLSYAEGCSMGHAYLTMEGENLVWQNGTKLIDDGYEYSHEIAEYDDNVVFYGGLPRQGVYFYALEGNSKDSTGYIFDSSLFEKVDSFKKYYSSINKQITVYYPRNNSEYDEIVKFMNQIGIKTVAWGSAPYPVDCYEKYPDYDFGEK